MNRIQFIDLAIGIREISESEFRSLSRDAVGILGDHYRGRPLELLEARIERLLLDSEAAFSQLPKAGSWIEWALWHRIVWGSPYSQMNFVGALACKEMVFDAWEVSERCAQDIFRAEMRLIQKLKTKGSFPIGLPASYPCPPSVFGRLDDRFATLLKSWSNIDVIIASMMYQRENRALLKRRSFISWANAAMRSGLTEPRCQEGLRRLFDWAEDDEIALEFLRMIDFEVALETWRGVLEGVRRHKEFHPRRGWAANLDSSR